MTLKKLSLYFHTIRFLKPIQIYGRIFSFLYSKIGFIKLPSVPVNLTSSSLKRTDFLFHEPWNNRKSLLDKKFTFLNMCVQLDKKNLWREQNQSMLWLFNLHYMNYLFLIPNDHRIDFVSGWIENNPAFKSIGWHPYVLSLRIINWCKIGFEDKRINTSLYIQAAYLYRNTEYYHPANHYLENARALIFAGMYFGQTGVSKDWYNKGISIIMEQLPSQVLKDSGYFEKSMMYHAIILEGFLDLINILPESEPLMNILKEYSKKMLTFLDATTHPDGSIALFNDSTEEIAPTTKELSDYAERLKISNSPSKDEIKLNADKTRSLNSFSESGFHIYKDEQLYLLIDAGSIGPDNIPAHAHADIFSYELSVFNEKIIVDSGVYEYEDGEMRNYVRSTKAHNTLTIDSKNQAECWGSFRVARRFSPKNISCKKNNDNIVISAEFDGYSKLIGDSLKHKRIFKIQNENKIVEIIDTVSGRGNHLSESRIHLHPLCTVDIKTELSDTILKVNKAEAEIDIIISIGEYRIEEGWYCPRFGVKEKNKVIVVFSQTIPVSLAYSIHY